MSISKTDNMFKVWNVSSGEEEESILLENTITSLSIDPEFKYLVVGDKDGLLTIYQTDYL